MSIRSKVVVSRIYLRNVRNQEVKIFNYKNILRNRNYSGWPVHCAFDSLPLPSFSTNSLLLALRVSWWYMSLLMAFKVTLIGRNIAEKWSQNLYNFVVDKIKVSMWTRNWYYLSQFDPILFNLTLHQLLFYISTFFIFELNRHPFGIYDIKFIWNHMSFIF